MTATTAPAGGAGRTTTSAFSRIYGLGSVYAKTLRDSRLALIIVGGLIGIFLLSSGIAFGEAYTTLESRLELKALVGALPPAMAGVYGNPFPTAIETLGGSIAWKTAASLGLMAGLPWATWERLLIWMGIGIVIYAAYGRRHSKLAQPEELTAAPVPEIVR